MSTLEQRIANRKQEAKDKQILEKATYIGSNGHLTHIGRSDMENRIFTYGDFQIEHAVPTSRDHPSDPWIRVLYKSSMVFEGSGDEVLAFVPGNWEPLLDGFYLEAQARTAGTLEAFRTQLEASQANEENAIRKKWGL